jgi:hypothetical protein
MRAGLTGSYPYRRNGAARTESASSDQVGHESPASSSQRAELESDSLTPKSKLYVSDVTVGG